MFSAKEPASSSALEFQKVLRGWDPEEVRDHLDTVASRVRHLESRIRTLEAELEEARRERDRAKAVISDPYASVSGHVADVLRDLDQHVASVRASADTEADRIRSEVLTLRSSMQEDLRAIRDHMASSLRELDAALEVDVAPATKAFVVLAEVGDEAPSIAGTTNEHTATGPAAAV